MKIIFLGEITGKSGRAAVKSLLSELREEADFVFANANGGTGGFGLGKAHSAMLRKSGLDAMTMGEYAYNKKDMVDFIQKIPFVLRGANFPYGNPGRSYGVYYSGDKSVTLINAVGQAGYNRLQLNNPFSVLSNLVEKIKEPGRPLIVNYHATTTAEKISMRFLLDGKVTALIGTGCKAQTADAFVTEKKTGYITDAGFCGSAVSVGGFQPEPEIRKFMNQIYERSMESEETARVQGVLIETDENGDCVKTESFSRVL